MKTKIIYILPIIVAIGVLSRVDLVLISLKPIESVKLGTLFMSFPIVLALTERFNEIFIVEKNAIKEKNIKRTSFASFCVGIVLAIAGFRILETFMEIPETAERLQKEIFTFIDIILTAAIIAGGTDGWHQLVALLQDITKAKREEIKKS
ncbi:membrane hypothetical protein [Tenacibaculum sediminilitoris]|uniref:hypothetical protein n=1 Tax=Tenacibaculum sediminilitoris TaxID=1820334 RepID=UPI0038964701